MSWLKDGTRKNNLYLTGFLVLIVLVLVQVFLTGPKPDTGFQGQDKLAHVVRVIDGDTIELLNGDTVRYLGINAPEKGDPWSQMSTELNRDLVEGKDIRLEYDMEKHDHYNRLLAYVYEGDTFVNLEIVKQGLAWSYIVEPNDFYAQDIEMAEADAKQAKMGLWARVSLLITNTINL